jgi:hypothetical protein
MIGEAVIQPTIKEPRKKKDYGMKRSVTNDFWIKIEFCLMGYSCYV